MKKWIILIVIMVFIGLPFTTIHAGNAPGPAPNSGDGVSDGSGFDDGPPSPGPQGN
jgi:hypothetical protein